MPRPSVINMQSERERQDKMGKAEEKRAKRRARNLKLMGK